MGSSQLVVLRKRSRIEMVTLDTLSSVVADEAVHFPTLTIFKIKIVGHRPKQTLEEIRVILSKNTRNNQRIPMNSWLMMIKKQG